ncbi:MAG: thiamine phosphate synthase, partial [Candidatus Acidiferrales bacterium]
IVCCVTSGKTANAGASGASRTLATIRAAIACGADWVQIREKDSPARELLALADKAVAMTRETAVAGRKTRILVNDRLDVALAAGAGGVLLGGASVDAAHVVRFCRSGNAPPEFRVGVSCHGAREALEAEQAGASYIFFGPVFDTPEKRAFGAPPGIEELRAVSSELRIPVIAIGGVNAANAGECFRAGASGIAAIRMFQEVSDVAALRNSIEGLRLGR